MATDPYASQSKGRTAWLIGGAVLLALIVGLGAGYYGSLAKAGDRPMSVLPKPGESAPAITPAAGTDPGPITGAEDPANMPEDVRAWLEHLRRIEGERSRLSNAQVGQAMVALTKLQLGGTESLLGDLLGDNPEDFNADVTPAQEFKVSTENIRSEWQALATDFRSLPPPAECAPIAANYNTTLGETSAMIMDIIGAINQSSENPDAAVAALSGMKGQSASRIDQSALATDDGVAQICAKYQTRKWFSIAADFGGGGLLDRLGGLAGL